MMGLGVTDAIALVVFLASWLGYHLFVERSKKGKSSLNALMNTYRMRWMQEMRDRDVRILDTQILGSLQNGAAFFASTTLIAIGGAATLLRGDNDVMQIFSTLPFGSVSSRALWEIKATGLTIIFAYTFFKFAWSYRLFNYAAILMGATPAHDSPDIAERQAMVLRTGEMIVVAGAHFNRGQRAFFFALAYLGWFIGPVIFGIMTLAVLLVIGLRQFHSAALRAVTLSLETMPNG